MNRRQINANFNRFLIFFLIGWGVIILALAIGLPLTPHYESYRTSYSESGEWSYDWDRFHTHRMIWVILFYGGCIIGACFLIVGFIFVYIAHYNNWILVQKSDVKTTPGKAIGYLFIPFYNFYWVFVSFRGLSEEINKSLTQKGIIKPKHANVGLATALCILSLICNIPFLNFLAIPATQVLLILTTLNQKNAVIQLVE